MRTVLSQSETHPPFARFSTGDVVAHACVRHRQGLVGAVAAKRVDAMLARAHLNSLRRYTLITRDALMDDLRETQPRGYSFDGEEKNIGTRCIAAPVLMSTVTRSRDYPSRAPGADHRCKDCADRDIGAGRADALTCGIGRRVTTAVRIVCCLLKTG
jgi:hypothetical protein